MRNTIIIKRSMIMTLYIYPVLFMFSNLSFFPQLSIYKTATDWGSHGFLDHFDSTPLDSDEDI